MNADKSYLISQSGDVDDDHLTFVIKSKIN